MNCIVTGGFGFIGSNLVERLIKDGHHVIVFDDLSTGKTENINSRSRNYKIDISCIESLMNLKKTWSFVDMVFHIAARPRVQVSIDRPLWTHEANVNGTLNMLLFCKKYGIKRFVYSSSSSLYGDQETLPLVEDMKPNPMSPYALQKLTGEEYCRLFHDLYGLETISLRYFNVYGRHQDPESDYACLIPKFMKFLHEGRTPTIFGDGENTRDFTQVEDVVDANIFSGFTGKGDIFGEAFNIGGGKNWSVNQVTTMIKNLTNQRDIEPIHIDPVIEARHTLADISKAKKLLNWEPKISLPVGLKDMYENLYGER